MIEVANKRHVHSIGPNDFYIGRPSPLGNPIKLAPNAPKGSTLPAFEAYLEAEIKARNPAIVNELKRIAQKARQGHRVRLICWCAPEPCHGNIIAKIIERRFMACEAA